MPFFFAFLATATFSLREIYRYRIFLNSLGYLVEVVNNFFL